MIKTAFRLLSLAALLVASPLAFAQDDLPNVNKPPAKPPADRQEDRQRERQEERQREQRERDQRDPAAADLPASFHRATQLMGMRVNAKGGERIGDIRNLAVNTENGRIRYAIVDDGSGTLYPIPMPAIKFAANRQQANVDTTTERMKDAPKFKPDGWNTIGDAKWGEVVHQFYGISRNADDDKERPDFVPANAVIGSKAETRRGDNLATVKDLMIDTEKNVVAYVVLDPGNKNFAVPWRSLNVTDTGKRVVVRGLERDDLRDAPGFANSRWPTYRDLKWDDNTNFDSRPPRWVYGMSESGNGGGGGGGGGGDSDGERGALGGWQTHGKYGEMFRPNRIERWSGTIVRTDTVTPLAGMDPGTAIVVRTNDGNVVVHLGPEWFVRHQQDRFAEGEQVEVSGSQVEIDQKSVVMATQVRLQGRTLTLRDPDGVPTWDAWQERGSRGNATGNPNQGNPGRGNDNNRGNAGNNNNNRPN